MTPMNYIVVKYEYEEGKFFACWQHPPLTSLYGYFKLLKRNNGLEIRLKISINAIDYFAIISSCFHYTILPKISPNRTDRSTVIIIKNLFAVFH